ncbi:SUMF1/EgtB/PvdO family nonheme iron enzyme [Candidatus Desantisbacteria bacterium]|nr:SUMF1/EgtB/PvdO family nonheme iron enzyme [Candidatus Desantisbacteria bacterium]
MVIFIDDLDRCNKENIVKVLEAVKLFLDFRGCIFVMGVSIEIIVKATSSVAHCEDGSEYLEKMIQVSYGLPPIHQDDMKIYFEEKISLFSYNDILNKYSDVIIKSFGDRITPRKIKQFINNLNLQIKISDNKGLFEKDFYDENNNKIILKIDHYIYWNILKEAFRINFDSIKDNTDIIKMTQTAYKENEAQIKNSNFENIDKIRYEVVKDILKNQMLREIVINLPDNAEIINILKFESLAVGQIHIETEDMKGMREHYRSGAMVKIEKGPFLYTEEKIKEKIDYDYEIDIFPVTIEEYCKFIDIKKPDKKELDNWISLEGRIKEKDGKYIVEKCYEKHPIIYVSWYGAKEYAKWMKKRLPEEKEWEKAARGPNGWIYPWGDEFDKGKCNTSESNNNDTTEVDKYPNGKSYYGCYDMAGNVWEWTDSWYDKNMDSKVLRGGSWYYDQEYARCADRDRYLPEYRNLDIGFRCARTL